MGRTPLLLAVTTAAGCTLAGGCGKPFNEEIGLVGTPPLPALSAESESPPLSGTPSLTTPDRRGWPLVTVQVPIKQVAHYPTYVSNLHLRQDGPWDKRYPTTATALDHRTDAGADIAAGLADPLWATGLLLWAPIDMVVLWHWPWNEDRSPAEAYARMPATETEAIWRWVDTTPTRIEWTDQGAAAPEPR